MYIYTEDMGNKEKLSKMHVTGVLEREKREIGIGCDFYLLNASFYSLMFLSLWRK